MPAGGRRRKKRRSAEFKAPTTRRAAHERQVPEAGSSPGRDRPTSTGRGRGRPRPPAPWGSFPLVELVVLLSLVLLVAGFFLQGARGVTMIIAGVTLGSLAGLEL